MLIVVVGGIVTNMVQCTITEIWEEVAEVEVVKPSVTKGLKELLENTTKVATDTNTETDKIHLSVNTQPSGPGKNVIEKWAEEDTEGEEKEKEDDLPPHPPAD